MMEISINFRSFPFNETAPTEIYTLSLHDALPIWCWIRGAFPASPMACTWFGTFPGMQKSTSLGRRGTMPWSVGRFSDRRVADREHPFARETRVITLQTLTSNERRELSF